MNPIEIRDQKLKTLDRVFKKFIDLTEKYCCDVKNDAPYWYNERTSVGFFAGAIWKCGGIVIEEYSSDKVWEGVKYSSRTDIWFMLDGKQYIAEAKFGFVRLQKGKEKKTIEWVQRLIKSALSDVQLITEPVQTKIGLAFVVPYLKKGKDNTDKRIESFLMSIKNSLEYDAIVAVFPDAARNLTDQGDFYPGEIMLACRSC